MENKNIRIGNRSDVLEVFDRVMRSIEGGDMDGYVETTCGKGFVIDFLIALKDAIDREVI